MFNTERNWKEHQRGKTPALDTAVAWSCKTRLVVRLATDTDSRMEQSPPTSSTWMTGSCMPGVKETLSFEFEKCSQMVMKTVVRIGEDCTTIRQHCRHRGQLQVPENPTGKLKP